MAAHPLIERLHVENYRVLRDVTFDDLTPLTVLFGPNGSGKSTVFDVFAFLHEAFTTNLRRAWERRNGIGEIRSRGSAGAVVLELDYRETPESRPVTYGLTLDEDAGAPVVVEEVLRFVDGGQILHFRRGSGVVHDEETGERVEERLEGTDLLAVSSLGQLSRHRHAAALRRFVSGWYLPDISAESTRSSAEAGPQERLSVSGDNLPNVLQYLREERPEKLERVFTALRDRIPGLERVEPEQLADGRLVLRLKDAAFEEPILARFVSDGTLKLLAYLTLLFEPTSASVVWIEEPEGALEPRLMPLIAEEARGAAERSQLLITTHSPQLVDALTPPELWALYRDENGFARTVRASEIAAVTAMVEAGGLLGDLWLEGYFGLGDPLRRSGRPA